MDILSTTWRHLVDILCTTYTHLVDIWTTCGQLMDIMWTTCGHSVDNLETLWTSCAQLVDIFPNTITWHFRPRGKTRITGSFIICTVRQMTGFVWLRIWKNGRFLLQRWWAFSFTNVGKLLTDDQMASQEGLCSMSLAGWLVIYLASKSVIQAVR